LFQVGEVQLPGDIDSDGEVAFADFVILARHFGQSEVTRAEGDLNGDGAVTFADFVILANNFGRKASDVDLADLSSGMASESERATDQVFARLLGLSRSSARI
jgi:hypothetical protein